MCQRIARLFAFTLLCGFLVSEFSGFFISDLFRILTFGFRISPAPALAPVPVPNWPIQSLASNCPLAKQVQIPSKMQAFFGRRIFILVNYGLFLTDSLSRDMSHLHAPA